MVRKIFLGCGIVSSVLYINSDVLGTLRIRATATLIKSSVS